MSRDIHPSAFSNERLPTPHEAALTPRRPPPPRRPPLGTSRPCLSSASKAGFFRFFLKPLSTSTSSLGGTSIQARRTGGGSSKGRFSHAQTGQGSSRVVITPARASHYPAHATHHHPGCQAHPFPHRPVTAFVLRAIAATAHPRERDRTKGPSFPPNTPNWPRSTLPTRPHLDRPSHHNRPPGCISLGTYDGASATSRLELN
jgi:hypothetical protein